MPSPSSRIFWAALFIAFAGSSFAQTARDATKDAVRDPRGAPSRGAKGPLPDPALLDGSAMEPEKRPEHGMLGEFEMPGDENAKGDKVGKTSEQQASASMGGGGQQQQDGSKNGIPSGGGSAGAQSSAQSSQGAQAGGGGAAGAENQAQGQQAGGPAGDSSNSQGSPGASADGIQAAQVSNGAAGQAGQSAPSGKPQQVALGDSSMQIKQQGGAAPNVVGAQQMPAGKDVPQQYDGKTPSGGKQSGGGRGNQGVEKGRVMPAGI